MKKKIVALSLVVAMVVMNSVVALGETVDAKKEGGVWKYYEHGTENEIANGNKKDVNITFTSNVPTVYSVDIVWGSLTGTYNGSSEWKPDTHSFNESTPTWSFVSGADKVEVINHSNSSITGNFTFSKNSALDTNYPGNSVSGTLTNSTIDIGSAVSKNTTSDLASLTNTATLNMQGNLNNNVSNQSITVGNIIVSLD